MTDWIGLVWTKWDLKEIIIMRCVLKRTEKIY